MDSNGRFEIGDVVTLRASGISMVVDSVIDVTHEEEGTWVKVWCVWMDRSACRQRDWFESKTLGLVKGISDGEE